MHEIMGPGAALFDYDNDGDLDAFLLQGEGTSRLFRNDLTAAGAATLRFTDVTDRAGIALRRYGMGAAVGDYDNDGDLDLFVTSFGADTLYRNNGNGTFTDATREAGVSDPLWSTSAAFVDYDRDGDLDLFVANYLDFTIADNKICHDPVGARDYCSPRAYRPVPDRLYRNDGRGRFVDVTEPCRHRQGRWQRVGRVGRRLQRRRLARSLRRQRCDGEPAVDQSPRRHVRGPGAAVGRGGERGGQPRGQHGHRLGRLRRRWRRGSVRHQHHRRDVCLLRERRQGGTSTIGAPAPGWRRPRRPLPDSAPTGSTTTTTAGSTCSSPTAPSTSSNRSADSRRRIA